MRVRVRVCRPFALIYLPLKKTRKKVEEGVLEVESHLPPPLLTTWTSWQKGRADRLISARWRPCLFSGKGKEGGGGGRLTDNLNVYTLPLYYWCKGHWLCVCVCVSEGANQGESNKFLLCWHSGLTLTTSISLSHSHTLPSGRPHGKKLTGQ